MKAARNRIRLQKRRPRIRMEGNHNPTAPTWVRDRFVDGPVTSGRMLISSWLRERFRILGWIFRLLRR